VIDRYAAPFVARALAPAARALTRLGVSADAVTVAALAIGLGAAWAIVYAPLAGLALILTSRVCDGLDGAMARLRGPTDRGAFLDAAFDFVFYAAVPLAFAVADPARNALPAAVLLFAFMGTASSFLAFAVLAGRRGLASLAFPQKGFFYLGGLTEAAETLGCFALMCLFPAWFPALAYGFAVACGVTTVMRWWWGWTVLGARDA
jgi:phosphatidylglycerophosphate synthase